MPRPTRSRRAGVLAVAAVLAAAVLVPLALLAGSGPAQAATLRAEAAYTCQYDGVESGLVPPLGGLPTPQLPSLGGSDPVRVAVALRAPRRVQAGQPLRLRGTATFTFGANATATNAATVFRLLSDSFGVDVDGGGVDRFLRTAELRTTRSTPGDPTVRATWELPELLVPTTASGALVLSLPREATVTNPVATTPAAVAFTGRLATDSRLQPERTVACALAPGQDAAATRIGVVAVAPARGAADPQAPATTPATTAPGTTAPGAPGAPAGLPGLPGAPRATTPGAAPSPATAPGARTGPTGVLAADPAPAATVAAGVTLPAWVVLLAGAVAAAGVPSAVGSYRRTRAPGAGGGARVGAALGAGAVGLLVLPLPLYAPAPAEAAGGQAQVTLSCVYEAQGSTSNEVPKSQPTGLSISLDVPASVRPGEVVTLTGSASVQAPEDIRRQASQLGYTTLDAISDAFSVGLTAGSRPRQVFVADRWQTGKTAIGNPLVVTGPLSFPSYAVPADARGSVRLELPRNEVLDRRPPPYSNPDTPRRTAVEFLASVTGNGTSATYLVSCWRTDGGAGLIASIPVVTGAGAGAGSTGTGAGTDASAGAGTGTGAAGQPGSAAPTGTAAEEAGTTTTPASTAPRATGTAAADAADGTPLLQGAGATPAAATTSSDVTVPVWLVLAVVALTLGSYGYTGWSRLRLRARGSAAETGR